MQFSHLMDEGFFVGKQDEDIHDVLDVDLAFLLPGLPFKLSKRLW